MAGTSSESPQLLGTRALLLIAAAALVPYALLPPKPFIADAIRAIVDNPVVQERPWIDAWTTDFWGVETGADYGTRSYRPLVTLTYALQARVLGTTPQVFHLGDMLLHAGAAVLLALLVLRLVPGTKWAVPAACLFAVHPIVSEAVCSMVGRADLMAAAALFGALVLHLSASDAPEPWKPEAGALALLAVALLSKEYAVAFPFIVVLVDVALTISGRAAPAGRGRRRAFWGMAFGLLAAYLLARLVLMGSLGGVPMLGPGDQPLVDQPLSIRWATAALLLLEPAARLLVAPYALNYFYGPGTVPIAASLFDPRALAGVALVVALVALALRWLLRRGEPVPLIAVGLFLLPLGPSLNTVSLAGVLFAERFLYVPAAGLALFVAWALERWAAAGVPRKLAHGALATVCVVFAVMTMIRVDQYRSTEALARASLPHYPRGANIWLEIGLAVGSQGKHEEAADALRRSLEIEPRSPKVWRNYAVALMGSKRYEESAAAWRRSLQLSSPDLGPLWAGLGSAELAAQRFEEAVRDLGRARELMPEDPQTSIAYGQALLRLAQRRLDQQRPGEAADAALRAQQLGTLPPEGLFLAALVLQRAGRTEQARPLFDESLARDPDLLRKKHQVAVDLDKQGRHAEAAEQFREILAANPEHVPTMFNLGRNLLLSGRNEEAAEYLRQGLARRDDPGARELLARAVGATGR